MDELKLANFVCGLSFEQIPSSALKVVRQMLLADLGTAIAGAKEDGCRQLRQILLDRGGKPEATVLVFGDRLPGPSAALLNGVMCRALDFCDAMAPGLHIGSSLIPAALAAAQISSSCSGRQFLTALAAGAEIASRMNLTEEAYNGFDPTGVAGVFGAAAAASRILGLSEEQTANALALAFNRSGGSFQSNVDGSLAVRLIQGWVAETGLTCATLAGAGLTGPANFLGGVYGYLHLFGKGKIQAASITKGLGEAFRLEDIVFKKYPSCGLTQGVTELCLKMVSRLQPEPQQIEQIEIRLPPYAYRLVGHGFKIGKNARVNAQFSAGFCAANAFVNQSSNLSHFGNDAVLDPRVNALIQKVSVVSDPEMDSRGHTAVDLFVTVAGGKKYREQLDIAPGFPGNPLTDEEHLDRFFNCIDFGRIPFFEQEKHQLIQVVETLDTMTDVKRLMEQLAMHEA